MTEKETKRRDCLGPDGAARIALERERQRAKWPADHDDEHGLGRLATAAAVVIFGRDKHAGDRVDDWAPLWAYKIFDEHRGDYARRLEIAGALVAAELDVAVRFGVARRTEKEIAAAAPGETWFHSTDEERWNASEEYPTREAAIAGAPEWHGLAPGDVFFVGRKATVAIHSDWGDHVVEQLGLNAYDGCGDPAEAWPDSTKEQEKELDDEITRVIDAWLDRHGLQPTFFTLTDVSKHHAPGGDA